MNERFQRTEMLLGSEGIGRLNSARIIVFGVGGVGGAVCEAAARAGIGHIELVDHDVVSITNINRQIIALTSTVGRKKVDVMRERILDINPAAEVVARDMFYTTETADEIDFSKYDYVVDAVDTVTAKLLIAEKCTSAGTPVISSMGTGNKLNPTRFEVCDIYKTEGCPLARIMRKELRKRGVGKLTVVFSPEEPIDTGAKEIGVRPVPGSVPFVPPAAGFVIAGKMIRDIVGVS